MSKSRLKSTSIQGVILLELSLILPVVLLFCLGALDIALLLREANITLQASRSAARSATTGRTQDWCSTEGEQAWQMDCSAVSLIPTLSPLDLGLGLSEPLRLSVERALRMGCQYLLLSGMRSSDWRVRVRAPIRAAEPPQAPQLRRAMIEVTAERISPDRQCILCFLGQFIQIRTEGQTVFPLLVRCEP